MDIFPLGTVSTATSCGTIDGRSYSMFEPNDGAKNKKVYTNMYTQMYDQTRLTRQQAFPYMTFSYSYRDIWAREFRQISHFVDSKNDGLTSFYTVDFSELITIDSIASVNGNWVISTEETRHFSEIDNYKSSEAFIWDGSKFRVGDVSSITTNTSISVDVSTNNYGSLSFSNAESNGCLYPIYQTFFSDNAIGEFEKGVFIYEDTPNKGFTRSGTIGFISKYKVG